MNRGHVREFEFKVDGLKICTSSVLNLMDELNQVYWSYEYHNMHFVWECNKQTARVQNK